MSKPAEGFMDHPVKCQLLKLLHEEFFNEDIGAYFKIILKSVRGVYCKASDIIRLRMMSNVGLLLKRY
jgi:hypothetical protein